MGIFENQGRRKVSKKRAVKPPRNRSETWIRLNVYGYEGTLWDRFHDLYHFRILAAVGGQIFFDIEPESGDFLNITRAVYCISGDFGSVFSSKNYDFSVLLAKPFRNLIRMCIQVTKQWINQNDEILALKQLVNNQRDCLGAKFWETPTPSPRLRVVQRRGKVFSSGLEWLINWIWPPSGGQPKNGDVHTLTQGAQDASNQGWGGGGGTWR